MIKNYNKVFMDIRRKETIQGRKQTKEVTCNGERGMMREDGNKEKRKE